MAGMRVLKMGVLWRVMRRAHDAGQLVRSVAAYSPGCMPSSLSALGQMGCHQWHPVAPGQCHYVLCVLPSWSGNVLRFTFCVLRFTFYVLYIPVSDSVATPMAKVWHFVVGMRDHRLRQKVMEHWGADITSYHGVSMSDVAQYAAGQHAVLQLDRSIGSSGASGGSGGSRGGRGSYRGGSHNDRSRSSGGSSGVNALGGSSSDPPQNPGAPGYKGCWGCGQSDHRAVDRPDCLKKWQAERAARQAAGEGKAPRKGGK